MSAELSVSGVRKARVARATESDAPAAQRVGPGRRTRGADDREGELSRLLHAAYAHWSRTRGRALTDAIVAAAVAERGVSVSKPYLSQLRTGKRRAPNAALLAALSDFFGVDSEYFYAGEQRRATVTDAELLAGLFDAQLRRLMLLATGLSGQSLGELCRLAAVCRSCEGLETGVSVL